jgi:hypothetical protein
MLMVYKLPYIFLLEDGMVTQVVYWDVVIKYLRQVRQEYSIDKPALPKIKITNKYINTDDENCQKNT